MILRNSFLSSSTTVRALLRVSTGILASLTGENALQILAFGMFLLYASQFSSMYNSVCPPVFLMVPTSTSLTIFIALAEAII